MLIVSGHPPSVVWDYTPRQISGYVLLIGKRHKNEAARDLSIYTLASRGDPKDVKKQFKELSGGS